MVKIIKNPLLLVIGLVLSFALEIKASDLIEFEERDNPTENLYLKGVALFSSHDPFSMIIKKVTASKFSHVGLVFSKSRESAPEEWICFESTGSASEVLKGVLPHVRLTPWEKVVENYNGRVVFRNLQTEHPEDDDIKEKEIISQFIQENDQKKYERNPVELLKSILKWNTKPDESTVFCSELAAKCLMDLGYLEPSCPNNFVPADFSQRRGMTLHGGTLGEEQEFKNKPSKFKKIIKYKDKLFFLLKKGI